MVRLKFSITLAYQVLDRPSDFIFNIQPAFTERQCVFDESLMVSQPVPVQALVSDANGSRFLRLQADAGQLKVSYQGTVDINHFQEDPAVLAEMPIADLPLDALTYVYPSRYCQSDKLRALAHYEFGHMTPGYTRVLAIQRWVNNRTRFLMGSSGTATSALETLVDQAGVCRDFAHLMIALCRALNMPARFVSGIDYGADPSLGPTDFHAYVEVMLSGRWYLFDPSGVAPPMGLIRLGTGRDAADIPFVTVFGNVYSDSPCVIIDAITDPAAGLQLPVYQHFALSSAGRTASAYTSF